MDAKDRRIQELELIVAAQARRIDELLARIDELERRLALNSSNSSKPPSSDGLRKKGKNRSLREVDGNKFGGQIGHKGDTLKQTDNPDISIYYDVEKCSACGRPLTDTPAITIIEKQEVDVVVKKVVTAHKASVKVCCCGKKNIAAMPEHVKAPVQYGANVRAMGVYLTNQFVAKSRIADIFRDLFQLPISDTALMAFDEECAERLAPFDTAVLESIKKADVKNLDETGMRIANKTQWVHVASTELLTHYRINQKRGSLLQGFVGTVIHDHWKPYFTLKNAQHGLCNAHHLRELKALIEIEKESWAKDMYDLLKESSRLINPPPETQRTISDKYDQIVAAGIEYHNSLGKLKLDSCKKRAGHNLLVRLRDFKTETLRFLYEAEVPFTNNLAERDLRMIKVKQKVSGSFRTEHGANAFAVNRSFISTVQKQNKNIFQYLGNIFNGTFNLNALVNA